MTANRAPVDAQDRKGVHRRPSPSLRRLTPGYRGRSAVFASQERGTDLPRPQRHPDFREADRRKVTWVVSIASALIIVSAVALISLYGESTHKKPADPAAHLPAVLPYQPRAYLGVYASGVPYSYAGVSAFSATTGVTPEIVLYYSGWLEPFRSQFAAMVARHHAVPLVQIDPTDISLTRIASGHYDAYLRSYASAVKAFGGRVILGFGHEANGDWYSWGYRHVSPAAFVAAWRHIVTVFRRQGADNVMWLWTINISECRCHIDSPAPWWPGASYVNWVGIDGYYYKPSWKFASLFGPTIKAVRALTLDPILISETAAPAAIQTTKIPDLFAGIRAYGLLGFVWFNLNKEHQYEDWRISSRAASVVFHRGAQMLKRPAP